VTAYGCGRLPAARGRAGAGRRLPGWSERTPTTGPRTAVIWAPCARRSTPARPLVVVDVGGGPAGSPCAGRGRHRVTVVDASPTPCALTRRAPTPVADRVAAFKVTGRLADLGTGGSADLILCHSLLEVVDDRPRCGPPRRHPAPGAACRWWCEPGAACCPGPWAGTWTGHRAAHRPRGRAGPGTSCAAARPDTAGRCWPVRVSRSKRSMVYGSRRPAPAPSPTRTRSAAGSSWPRRTPPYRDIATQLHLYARKP